MARPLRITYPGAYYHVTTRGNERSDIYKSQRDREKFLSYLESGRERYGAVIHAFCLMRNHYQSIAEDATRKPVRDHAAYYRSLTLTPGVNGRTDGCVASPISSAG